MHTNSTFQITWILSAKLNTACLSSKARLDLGWACVVYRMVVWIRPKSALIVYYCLETKNCTLQPKQLWKFRTPTWIAYGLLRTSKWKPRNKYFIVTQHPGGNTKGTEDFHWWRKNTKKSMKPLVGGHSLSIEETLTAAPCLPGKQNKV